MKPKQKRIVVMLVAANVIIILGLVLWVSQALNTEPSSAPTPTRQVDMVEAPTEPVVTPSRSALSSNSSEPTGTSPLPTAASYEACQWRAAQLLANAGLDGSVVLASGDTLRFDIAHSLAPDQTVDEAAQSVWLAFDVALALVEEECDLFTQIEVIVLAQGSQTVTRISARVSAADLVAFNAGDLTEDEFIQCVTYQVSDE